MSEKESRVIRIFTARACAAPLEDAAKLYQAQTGVRIEVSACNRHCASPVAEEAAGTGANHDFLVEIAEDGIYDLAISGAEYLLDDGEIRGIVLKGERQLIAYRRSALVVPAGNPAGIRTLADLGRPGVRVAISMIDCLKGLWEDVTARLGLADQVQRNITFRANGCVAIVEALAQRKADAAIAWSSFAHLAEGRIEIIETPREQQVWRATSVALLSTSKQPERARPFMRFLGTPAAAACYKHYGWAPSGTGAG
jgi:molybdate transport system substrate-binding protein